MAVWPTRWIDDDLNYKADWTGQPGFASETIVSIISVTVTGTACVVDPTQTTHDASSVTVQLAGGSSQSEAVVKIVVECASGNRFTGVVQIRSY